MKGILAKPKVGDYVVIGNIFGYGHTPGELNVCRVVEDIDLTNHFLFYSYFWKALVPVNYLITNYRFATDAEALRARLIR